MARDNAFVNRVVRRHNYMTALHMLCVKQGWEKEYAHYVLGRNEEKCANGGRKEFIRKATRLLALNYDGIHDGSEPALSPRLLPATNPLSQPLRYSKEWRENGPV